jgi:hypothetical protein
MTRDHDRPRKRMMLNFLMRPLSAGDLTPAGGCQVLDELSDFARHCVRRAGRIERSPSSILALPRKQAASDPRVFLSTQPFRLLYSSSNRDSH